MVYMELINQIWSSRIDCTDLTIIGWHDRWCSQIAKRCKASQIHMDFIHQPSELLHPTVAAWSFKAWEIDIIGLISPPSAKGHRVILAITDYFSKWAEAVPLAEVKTTNVINFIKHHVIHHLVSSDGSSIIMVLNSQVNHSISSAISIGFRMWCQLLTTLPPTG